MNSIQKSEAIKKGVVSRVFRTLSLQTLGERSQPAIETSARIVSKCFIFMYFLLPHCVPATWSYGKVSMIMQPQ